MIHAVYLLNCASEDPEIRDKSLAALIVALQRRRAAGRRRRRAAPGLGAQERRLGRRGAQARRRR